MSTLRDRLGAREIVVAPGAFDAFTARLIESAGFEAVYVSGAGVSYSMLCQPDVGLVSLAEMAGRVAHIAGAVSIPVIADGDNGHGNAMNTMRAVRLFEAAGAAAIQLEDQAFPKRCGHLEGKKLVSEQEMIGKIRAARRARRSDDFLIIGRTDSRSVLGISEALRRASLYAEAGADVVFVEAPRDRDELAQVAKALPGVPLVANMVEGGKTPMVAASDLEALGYSLVLFPNSLTRAFARAGRDVMRELRAAGSTAAVLDQMVSFDELNDMTGLASLSALEAEFVPES